MVFPLLPIGVGLATGLGGFGLGSLFGKTKKEQQIAQPSNIDVYSPTEAWQYSPTQIFAPTTQYQIRSPGASQVSKKVIETVSTPSQTVSPTVSPQIIPTAGVETKSELLPIVLIAVAGIVAFGYMKGKQKK